LRRPELIEVDGHLSRCTVCRGKLDVGQPVVESLHHEFAKEVQEQISHLSFEQLADFVDGKLDAVDQEITESHLEICTSCQQERDDLRAFKQEITAVPAPVGRQIRWIPILLRVTAIAAAMVFVAWASTMTLRNRIAELDKQLQHADAEIQKLRAERIKQIADSDRVTIKDAGRNIKIDRNGNLHGLETTPAEYQEIVRTALLNKQIQTPPDLEKLITKSGVVLGDSPKEIPFKLLKPVGTVVENDRPEFRWEPLAGAEKYRVTILDDAFNPAADSGWLQGTTWTTKNPLRRGSSYIWQVTAVKNGQEVSSPQPPAGEARFKILHRSEFEQLEQARTQYGGGSHLLLGILYAQSGLLDDAEEQFQLLTDANPNSTEVKDMLLQIRKLRTTQNPSPMTTKDAQ
jgi:hypothetical protein